MLSSSIEVIEYDHRYDDQAVLIAREMHKNSVYSHMPLDEGKVIAQLSGCGKSYPDRYFRMAVRGSELLGGFYGVIRKTFFCDELTAHDMGWWIKSTARGSKAAILLLIDFADWGQQRGARVIMVGQSTGTNIERTTRLYEHCGFKVIGFNAAKVYE